MLEEFHPRLVLADIQLPGMDGLEMTRRIKADPRHRGVLVVALTAYAMKGDEDTALAAGCDGYITKPIDTRVLGARLREYLGRGGTPQPAPAAGLSGLVSEDDRPGIAPALSGRGAGRDPKVAQAVAGRPEPLAAAATAHQWVGSAGLLGFPAVSGWAREVEQILREAPIDVGRLDEALQALDNQLSNPTSTGSPAAPAPVYALPPARVLLAGADPEMLAVVKAILRSQAVDCLAAADGVAALQAALEDKPDVAVLDADLPRLNGCQVLRRSANAACLLRCCSSVHVRSRKPLAPTITLPNRSSPSTSSCGSSACSERSAPNEPTHRPSP